MPAQVDLIVSIREAGAHLVLDITSGQLPAVVHWGADLGPLRERCSGIGADGNGPGSAQRRR